MVFAAQSLALAALELIVRTDSDVIAEDLVSLEIDIPDGVRVEALSVAELPRDWKAYPRPASLQAIGSSWVTERRSAVLSVPPVIGPRERNYILNPAHSDFTRVTIVGTEAFHLDPRLRK